MTANNIAYWDISNQMWGLLGVDVSNGLYPSPYYSGCIALDSTNNILYVGANSSSVTDTSGTITTVNRIAGWNVITKRWFLLGSGTKNGFNGPGIALTLDSSQNLYIGGVPTIVYDPSNTLSINLCAVWNPYTTRWSQMGGPSTTISNGTNNSVYSIALDNSNQILYVTGNFGLVSDGYVVSQNVTNIAYFSLNKQSWFPLGSNTQNGINSTGYALAYDPYTNYLYVGGNFSTVYDISTNGQSVNYIAYWNATTQRWLPIGSSLQNGINAQCTAMILDGGGNLYTGGSFSIVKDHSLL
jgi:hypothetical protein